MLVVRNPSANAGDIRDAGLIPGSGRSPGGGHGNPLYYSCSKNPMDRGGYSRVCLLWERTPEDVGGLEGAKSQPKGKVV